MATLAYDYVGPGKASRRPVNIFGARQVASLTGQFSFDNSYPTGGEDISDIFNHFKELTSLWMESPIDSAGTGKHVVIDFTAKKAMLFTNAATPAEVAGASDQSGAASLRFRAEGFV